jgi:hypothetical protein
MAFVADYLRTSQREARRLYLTCHSGLGRLRQEGQQLADFLDVPLVDHVRPG